MREENAFEVRPKLKSLLAEATGVLAKLDAERLEELALSCQALNRDKDSAGQLLNEPEVREVKREMAVFAEVLEATRTNVAVMSRLRELRGNRVEYSAGQQSK